MLTKPYFQTPQTSAKKQKLFISSLALLAVLGATLFFLSSFNSLLIIVLCTISFLILSFVFSRDYFLVPTLTAVVASIYTTIANDYNHLALRMLDGCLTGLYTIIPLLAAKIVIRKNRELAIILTPLFFFTMWFGKKLYVGAAPFSTLRENGRDIVVNSEITSYGVYYYFLKYLEQSAIVMIACVTLVSAQKLCNLKVSK